MASDNKGTETATRNIQPTRRAEIIGASQSESDENDTATKAQDNKSKPVKEQKKVSDNKQKQKDSKEEQNAGNKGNQSSNRDDRDNNRKNEREEGDYSYQKNQKRNRDDRRQDDPPRQEKTRDDRQDGERRREQRRRELQDYDISIEGDFKENFSNWIIVKDDRVDEYVRKAEKLLKEHKFISIKGINNYIMEAFLVAQEVCRKVKNLQRINIPSSIYVKEIWYPRRKDLDKKVQSKIHPLITIELSKSTLTKKHIGYQAYSDQLVNEDYNRNQRRRQKNNDTRDNKDDRDNKGDRDNKADRDNQRDNNRDRDNNNRDRERDNNRDRERR